MCVDRGMGDDEAVARGERKRFVDSTTAGFQSGRLFFILYANSLTRLLRLEKNKI